MQSSWKRSRNERSKKKPRRKRKRRFEDSLKKDSYEVIQTKSRKLSSKKRKNLVMHRKLTLGIPSSLQPLETKSTKMQHLK
jgi:hypothetical protein